MQPIVSCGILSPWEPGIFSRAIFVVSILIFVASQLLIAVWPAKMKKSVEKLRPFKMKSLLTTKTVSANAVFNAGLS